VPEGAAVGEGVGLELSGGDKGKVCGAHDEGIEAVDLVAADEELEIPGGVTASTAGGGLGEADMVLGAEDLDEGHAVAESVVPGFSEAVGGEAEHEFDGEVGVVGKFAVVVEGEVGGVDAMFGGDAADPAWGGAGGFGVTGEVDIEGFRLMDIRGPEEADVAIAEGGAAGDALDGEFDGSVGEEVVALGAFEAPEGGGGLVEFDGVGVDDAEFHGGTAGFEEEGGIVGGAIVDEFEVETGDGGDEEGFGAEAVGEAGDAAIAGTVAGEGFVIDCFVIDDDDGDVATVEQMPWLIGNAEGDIGAGEGGDLGGEEAEEEEEGEKESHDGHVIR
jgi:hypothetical protein